MNEKEGCDATPVRVLPEAVVEQVEKFLRNVLWETENITDGDMAHIKELLTALRAETGGDSDGNE